MMVRILVVIGFGTTSLLLGAEELKQKVQVSKTERVEFPSGGTLRLKNSIGVLTVEGWDQPGAEITTVKSTKAEYASAEREKASHALDKVRIVAARQGEELVITTDFPRHRGFPPSSPVGGATNFVLDYRIRVPRDARLLVDHDVGEVNIDGVVSDIQVTLLQGEIMLHLPEEGRYNINAKSDFGNVNSDFPGPERRRLWPIGHRIVNEISPPAQRLNLRVGFGDIVILKIRRPLTPPPLNQ